MFKALFKRREQPRNMTLDDVIQRYHGSSTLAGVAINESTSMQVVAVSCAVRIISEGLAMLPVHVYRRRKSGPGKDRATDHWLDALLHDSGREGPNKWQTPYEFKELLTGHASLRGDGYSWISGRSPKGDVLELLPIDPQCVSPRLDKDYNLTYTVTDRNGGQRRDVPASEIFHVRGFSQNGFRGIFPVGLHREALGLALAAEHHGAKFLGNFAQPAGVLTTPNKLVPEDIEKIRKSWHAAMGGDNAFKTALLDNQLTWNKVTMTNEEAQYLDTRKFQIQEIARMFRVPPHMLGDLERATFSNIEEQSLSFIRDTLMAWIKRWEGALNYRLLSQRDREQGYFAEFMVDALLRGDYETRVNGYQKMVNMGAMSPNEVREKENMNPRDGGDIYLTPVNMTTNPDQNAAAKDDGKKQPQKEKAA